MTRSQGFPRQARLTRPAEFRRVFADGLRTGDRNMLVVAAPNDRGQARLGLAISRKVSPKAVVRNRLKRLIREAFRRKRLELPALDFVVVGRPGMAALAPEALRAALYKHWEELSRRSCARS